MLFSICFAKYFLKTKTKDSKYSLFPFHVIHIRKSLNLNFKNKSNLLRKGLQK